MRRAKDRKDIIKFGKHIAKLRRIRKLSQRDLSYLCRIDNSRIGKIETGRISIGFVTMRQLASALKISLPELMDFDEKFFPLDSKPTP